MLLCKLPPTQIVSELALGHHAEPAQHSAMLPFISQWSLIQSQRENAAQILAPRVVTDVQPDVQQGPLLVFIQEESQGICQCLVTKAGLTALWGHCCVARMSPEPRLQVSTGMVLSGP